MTRARSLLLAVVTLVCPVLASAQMYSTSARTGVYYETLSFGDGIAFSKISELTIPFVLTQRLGNRLTLDLSSAYANASVTEPGGGEVTYSGLVDTDVRGTIAVIPGRLLFNIVGSLLEVGAGAQPGAWIGKLLDGRDRTLAGPTAPSAGLLFVGPLYPADCHLPPEVTS